MTEAMADVLDSVRSCTYRGWSVRALVEETGRDPAEVDRALRELQALGHVRRSPTGWRTPATSNRQTPRRRHLMRSSTRTYCGLGPDVSDPDGELCTRCALAERATPQAAVAAQLGAAVATLRGAAGLAPRDLAVRAKRAEMSVGRVETGEAGDPRVVADILETIARTLRETGWDGLQGGKNDATT